MELVYHLVTKGRWQVYKSEEDTEELRQIAGVSAFALERARGRVWAASPCGADPGRSEAGAAWGVALGRPRGGPGSWGRLPADLRPGCSPEVCGLFSH